MSNWEDNVKTMNAEEVAAVLSYSREDDVLENCEERLCDLAGLSEDYNKIKAGEYVPKNEDDWVIDEEDLTEKAAEILGVNIDGRDIYYYNEEELAAIIRSSGEWDGDLIERLCDLASLSEEYETWEEDSPEKLVDKAAEILDVDIGYGCPWREKDKSIVEELPDSEKEKSIAEMNAEEVAEVIRNSDEWIPECNERLCDLAGLSEEYEAADGKTFEEVIDKAAEILDVDIGYGRPSEKEKPIAEELPDKAQDTVKKPDKQEEKNSNKGAQSAFFSLGDLKASAKAIKDKENKEEKDRSPISANKNKGFGLE